jgi:hypothetical protein
MGVLEWLLRVVSLVNLDHQGNRRLFTIRPGFAPVTRPRSWASL